MTLPTINERTNDEVIVRSTDRYFQSARNITSPISVAYNGKYVCFGAIVTDVALDDAQIASLQIQIGEIPGVYAAFIRIGSCRIPIDRVPADHELKIGVEASYTITPIPVE
jgi:hypothetical protein